MQTASQKQWSQVACVGEPQPQTWDDYERGCLLTFGGGYKSANESEAFRHGMQTVFNLLRSEFPPAEKCKAALAALSSQSGDGDAQWLREFADTAVRSGPEHFRKQLHAIADRHDILREQNETLRSACMAGRALPHVVRMEELHGEPWRQKVNDMLDQIDHALGQKIPSDFAAAALPPAAPQ